MNELALFAGAGGGILGGQLLGWRTICAVESNAYAASVLAARQNDGLLAPFPIWDDVRTFDGRPWRGRVDVVSGGFPCQDISSAGKGAGISGERSGLWVEMARIIGEVRPRFAFVENSPMLTARGLGVVLGDLAALGFDARWGVLGAADVGAPHKRERIWIVADADRQQRGSGGMGQDARPDGRKDVRRRGESQSWDAANTNGIDIWELPRRKRREERTTQPAKSADYCSSQSVANTDDEGPQRRRQLGKPQRGRQTKARVRHDTAGFGRESWWQSEPDVGRVANGVAARVDRFKAIGNGQVPLCAATAFRLLSEQIEP